MCLIIKKKCRLYVSLDHYKVQLLFQKTNVQIRLSTFSLCLIFLSCASTKMSTSTLMIQRGFMEGLPNAYQSNFPLRE